jgi:hypothetical protein
MKRRAYLPLVALLVAAMIVPAGCGSKEEENAPPPQTTQPPDAASEEPEIVRLPTDALVEAVDPDNALVTLNVGSRHGATEYLTYVVYRDDGYVGQAQAAKVLTAKSSARINRKLTPRAVRVGDAAEAVNFGEDTPAIEAVVEGVDMDGGIVILSAGAEDGVEKEVKFFLYRGDEYVGRIEVDRVLPTKSAARIVEAMTATSIHPGDSALTRFKIGTRVAQKSPPPPPITAMATGVDAAQEHVIINAGVKHDVKKGYPFFIYRGAEYIGKARVVSVFPMLSMARIVDKMTLANVKSGDQLTTRLKSGPAPGSGPVPAINATVAAADNDNGIVILSIEADSGVKKGYTFFVHRGDDYAGQVRVVSVFATRCAARIDEAMTRSAIKPGDGAKTRLGGF